VFRPRSCRVIYYFDTPTLEIRHQSFDHVKDQSQINEMLKDQIKIKLRYQSKRKKLRGKKRTTIEIYIDSSHVPIIN
jgi:hypothetical protein